MKKLSIFAVALAAMTFTACGGKKNANTEEETKVKTFEQEQVEASIKMHIDSLAASLGELKQLPIMTEGEDGIQLTKEEKQVKPDYLLDPAVAENATTLAEKYRMLSALTVDKKVAELYEMPAIEDFDKAITKLASEINDPSFKVLDTPNTIYETTQALYNAMEENGRINFFWQIVSTSLVEQLYILSQNTDKFIGAFDDDAAANITFRIVLLTDAVERLAQYDEEFTPVAQAISPLVVLNAISVDQLKTQLAEARQEIIAARNILLQ